MDQLPVAYRYMEEVYAKQLLMWGILRISTTQSVADIEGRQSDKLDSGLDLYLDGSYEDDPGIELKAAANRVGVEIVSGDHHPGTDQVSVAIIRNCRNVQMGIGSYITQVPGYMVCLSSDPNSRAFPGKDWVFEILNPVAFAEAIMRAASGRLPPLYKCDTVVYEDRRLSAFDAKQACADPMIKASGRGYEEEREVRIFWPQRMHPQPFCVTSLDLLRHIRLFKAPLKSRLLFR